MELLIFGTIFAAILLHKSKPISGIETVNTVEYEITVYDYEMGEIMHTIVFDSEIEAENYRKSRIEDAKQRGFKFDKKRQTLFSCFGWNPETKDHITILYKEISKQKTVVTKESSVPKLPSINIPPINYKYGK